MVQLLALAIAVAALVAPGWRALALAPLGLLGVVLIGNLARSARAYWSTRKPVLLLRTFEFGLGKRFHASAVLDRLAHVRGQLDVLGRTCLSWVIGCSETASESMRHRIVEAVRAGSRIRFIVQKECVTIPFFSSAEMEKLRQHRRLVIEVCRKIEQHLKGVETHGGTFSLLFTDQQVVQSMARVVEDQARFGHLVVSLRTSFKSGEHHDPPDPQSAQLGASWDPHLLFRLGCSEAEEYGRRLDLVLSSSVSAADYLTTLHQRISLAVRDYDRQYGSPLRKDAGASLAKHVVRCFLAESRTELQPPPVSVHFLVTRKCPDKCDICTQSQRGEDIIDTNGAKEILRQLRDFGVRAVVLSGGDPLYRDDIFTLLDAAVTKDPLATGNPLAVGILTRGLRPTNVASRSVTEEEATKIAEKCSWVQISIDTFRFHAGGKNPRDSVESANRIWKALGQRSDRMEVCYTIHRTNVTEISSLLTDAERAGLQKGVPIRLKLASSRQRDASFLCRVRDLSDLCRDLLVLSGTQNSPYPVNAKYMHRMMDGQGTRLLDVEQGLPVKAAMDRCEAGKFGCLVQQMTCTIDCDGRVYPCCYLFDDNVGSSKHRIPVGSLDSRVDLNASGIRGAIREVWKHQSHHPMIPIDPVVCGRCTRHMHQNEFLNSVWLALQEGAALSLAEDLDAQMRNSDATDRDHKWWKNAQDSFWL